MTSRSEAQTTPEPAAPAFTWAAALRELAVRAHMRGLLAPLPPMPSDGDVSATIREAMALQGVPAFTLSDAVREHIIDLDTRLRRVVLFIDGDLREAREELAAAQEGGEEYAEEAAEWRGRIAALEELAEALGERKP